MGSQAQAVRDDLFKAAVVAVLQTKDHYVSQSHLDKFGITLKHLDLKTGDIEHKEGTARLAPMPSATIEQIVASNQAKPWEFDDDLFPRGNEEWEQRDREDPDARFYQALRVHDALGGYARVCGHIKENKWRLCPDDAVYLQGFDEKRRLCYQHQAVCEPYSEPGVLDSSRPCIVASQLDATPFIEGRLLKSELNALIVLATRYDVDSKYVNCDEYVITVVTSSDRKVRLAQGKINLARKTFDVSLSDALDFESGFEKNSENWYTLLGWFAGTMAPPASWS
ncbi:hypothetical protein ISF_01075 [Cordyceps fumosorosea ARSEF 2679]|uniref:Uncharacterized protein n=1 Tax=Cordyceps fumosorosea (strain ARSEF 2679) TaxID=1081104 RepID=A0A162LQN2_CORFA|nr:hypothetical protein ISF_01075 [Cordyceps fumosorosea ARSEF 2679]OAA74174.1 hypothetical protein ISF_01075 [Cordyceps fumosorosea ARSEF 2679]